MDQNHGQAPKLTANGYGPLSTHTFEKFSELSGQSESEMKNLGKGPSKFLLKMKLAREDGDG